MIEDVIPVMWDDAKPSSHPIIVQNVTYAEDIISLFDSQINSSILGFSGISIQGLCVTDDQQVINE